ncbi:contact-dependent growth inhibition system immunity protein [Gallibacterium melopsittaci]|uniref:Contact-dependent growth inhibition system immunity protein n=1 Tax=Gallibacterium melopsittaci TaxID=516063 RepID=A0ABV6HW04_9PAST
MNVNKGILVRKNNEFILVTSYLISLIDVTDPEQDFIYLPIDISFDDLGAMIKKKLSASKVLNNEEFSKIMNSDKIKKLDKNLEIDMKKKFNYKNRKSIYQYMDFLTIDINNNKIIIKPKHQDSLDGFTTLKNSEGEITQFEYPLTITDEELGKATMDAFEYCTSIYSFIRENSSK